MVNAFTIASICTIAGVIAAGLVFASAAITMMFVGLGVAVSVTTVCMEGRHE